MPSGVEHSKVATARYAALYLIAASMPSGVEHMEVAVFSLLLRIGLIAASMPSGVEHYKRTPRACSCGATDRRLDAFGR